MKKLPTKQSFIDPKKNNGFIEDEVKKIPLDKIIIDSNVRHNYDDEKIKELANSIEEVGLIEPLTVEDNGNGTYTLTTGHRRYKAHQYLFEKKEKTTFRFALCYVRKILPEKRDIIQLIENIQREDLSHEEEEKAIRKIMKSGNTQDEIAKMLGKNKSYISRAIKASEIRDKLKLEGIETSNIPTRTLLEIEKLSGNEKVAARQLAQKKKLSGKKIEEKINSDQKELKKIEDLIKKLRKSKKFQPLSDIFEKHLNDFLSKKPSTSNDFKMPEVATRQLLKTDGTKNEITIQYFKQNEGVDNNNIDKGYHLTALLNGKYIYVEENEMSVKNDVDAEVFTIYKAIEIIATEHSKTQVPISVHIKHFQYLEENTHIASAKSLAKNKNIIIKMNWSPEMLG